jgi:adenosylhomocysteine nucleosidase
MITAPDAHELPPPPVAADGPRVVVICAVGAERRWLEGAAGAGVEVLTSGIGAAAARRRGEQAIARGATAIVSAGFCGALAPDLKVGDLVVAERVIDAATGREFTPDATLLKRAPGRRGILVTTPRIVRTPRDRALLSGLACDMESAVLAEVARAAGVPFLALRAVTDEARHTLPDFDRLTDKAGALTPGFGLLHFLTRPADIPRLLRLGPASRKAGRSLRAGMAALLGQEAG